MAVVLEYGSRGGQNEDGNYEKVDDEEYNDEKSNEEKGHLGDESSSYSCASQIKPERGSDQSSSCFQRRLPSFRT